MFCEKCGSKLEEDAAFCTNCGARVEEYVPSSAEPGQQSPAPVVYTNVQQSNSVSFGGAIKLFFKNYANFTGRASRGEYWWVFLFNVIISTVLGIIPLIGWILGILYSLAMFVGGLSLCIRRLHDTGKSWPHILIFLIPIAGPIILIVWLCKASDGDNRWGSGPRIVMYPNAGDAPAAHAQAPRRAPEAVRPEPAKAPAAPEAPEISDAPAAPAVPAAPAAPEAPEIPAAPEVDPAPGVVAIYDCDGETRRVTVQRFPCRIGRDSASVQLPLSDPKASRIHAELSYADGDILIRDLQSANGTFVNGEKITDAVKLSPDDEVVVGMTRLRFEVQS